MPKLPCSDNTEIKYDSAKHLDQVMLNARQQHLDMNDAHLLYFDMKWAEFEIADLAHDTAWQEKSLKIFKNTVLLQENDDAPVSQWSERQAANLWFFLITTLKIVMEMIRLSPSDHKKKAYNIPALKNAAKAVIEEFFAEDGLLHADLELSTMPTSSPATSPSKSPDPQQIQYQSGMTQNAIKCKKGIFQEFHF